jgi:hypothetical protein
MVNHQDEMVELLKDNSVTLLDSDSPLFSTLASSAEQTCGKVQDPVIEISATTNRTTQQHHQHLSLHEVLRKVENIVNKFLEKRNELRYKKIACGPTYAASLGPRGSYFGGSEKASSGGDQW